MSNLHNKYTLATMLCDSISNLKTLLESKPYDHNTVIGLHIIELKNLLGILEHINNPLDYNRVLIEICQKLSDYRGEFIKHINDEEVSNNINHIASILDTPVFSYL